MISIILIEPEWASNVGAVARVMGNFGFKDLVIVNPECKIDDIEALKRAKHAVNILKKAKIVNFSHLKKFDYLIATTSKLGTDYNISRTPLTPEQLSKKLPKNKKIGIVFGREGEGLHNDEIKECDFVVAIPSSKKYPALNISHAVAVILYELSKSNKDRIGNFTAISKKEKDNLLKLINEVIDSLQFSTKEKKETQRLIWKRILGKSFLSKREAFALFGFFRKINRK